MTLVNPIKSLLVKIQVVSSSFEVADFEFDNQIALSPTNIKGEVFKLQTTFVIKSTTLVFNYNVPCQIMNNICIYGILNRKKNSLDSYFFFFCPLYSPVRVSSIRLQQYAASCTSFPFGKCADGTFRHVSPRHLSHKKKSKCESRK